MLYSNTLNITDTLSLCNYCQFSCTLYNICTHNMPYSNTLNITIILSLCNYC